MAKKYLIVETDTMPPREVPCDPANVGRQMRDLRAQGYRASVIDEDERIKFGQLSQKLRRK